MSASDVLTRLQKWYGIHCDGSREHACGIRLETLGGPGWSLRIDLEGTALQHLAYAHERQHPDREHDWCFLKVDGTQLWISCGPQNLEEGLALFFNDILPNHADPNYLYDLQVPVSGLVEERFVAAQGRLIDEETLELVAVQPPSERELSVWTELVGLDPGGSREEVLPLFEAGQQVTVQLEASGSGVSLVARGLSDDGWH